MEEKKSLNKKNSLIAGIILLIVPAAVILVLLNDGNNKKELPADKKTEEKVSPEQELTNALKAYKTDSSEVGVFNLGKAYIDNKMYKESIDANLKVIQLNPKNSSALNNLGFAYGCLKEWDSGIKYCQMALDLDPNFQLASNNLNWMKDEKSKSSK